MSHPEICSMTATELSNLIRSKALSAKEVMEAHLSQVERINPIVNSIVTFLPETAMNQAKQADAAISRGELSGPLHGLPVAHKDLALTKGIRTTFGSPIYADHIPDENSLIVERLQNAGAITIGKTNTPEFGAGSQTFNPVFGKTLNPYDITKTCGGSSGGAAVALACGMIPIADGSDTGGSLRNPASFCNVVGFRPSPGRVPIWPNSAGWYELGVHGPMARTVQDVALILSAIAGPDPRSPISIHEDASIFKSPLERDFKGCRVAWSLDLGMLPIDARVTAALEAKRYIFDEMGCIVEDAWPDLKDAEEVFNVWRAWRFAQLYSPLLEKHREKIKDTVIWNIENGLKLTGPQISDAEIKRTKLYHHLRQFMSRYRFLILPTCQVPPFDVDQSYITEINNVKMDTYISWMKTCSLISATGLPAISVPCGFTVEGLPVGIQIVGRHHCDFSVLQFAHAFEQRTQVSKIRPPLVETI